MTETKVERVKNATYHDTKGDLFTSFNVDDFDVPRGRDEVWRFTPLRRLRGLHDGTFPEATTPDVSVDVPESASGVTVEKVTRDDERIGTAGAPVDRVGAQAWTAMEEATLVTFARNSSNTDPVTVTVTGRGADVTSFTDVSIVVEDGAEAIVNIRYTGDGTHSDNHEYIVGDNARLTVVVHVDWDDTAVHLGNQRAKLGRDAVLRHNVACFGGGVVRLIPSVKFTAPGGDAELLGVYFADDGQFFEQRLLVDHAEPNCRSNVLYKGALQADPSSDLPDARTAWVGDVLIRANAQGTDTYETNRNLVLTEGARADAVPNLEIETGEIVGAGHAATVGRFDDDQLFYLLSRGIDPNQARRLIVRGFFSEVIGRIPVKAVRDQLEEQIAEELEGTRL
ncbi:Fe-S cluster assembly protein SufD [Corynebacterium meridianum]|uniref:Fe-S cluster assembly protein SufD n=1 Tax=Corynebacterium meridianum TaxID=2765363 RepID=A0A934I2J2_9CORY|nr:Fe-S cluster assembly protein SufD [Corynebacterium meridianum]MBI8988931.1 Fe-S cluster assembly protein SufD [Corynebacterium meridianum]